MPFVKGESGNPVGRPPGSRNTKTLLCEAMLGAESEGLARRLIDLAHAGDKTALRLCADRVLPCGVNRPIVIDLPQVDDGESARRAIKAVIAATGKGELAPREADELLRVLERGARIIGVLEAADAAVRVNQPRHVRVTWVEPKERQDKWKAYWKERYEELYGPLPDLPDPEEDGWLPPEKAPAAADASGAVDKGVRPDQGDGPPSPPAATAGEGGNNNGNNKNTMGATDDPRPAQRPSRDRGPPRNARSLRVASGRVVRWRNGVPDPAPMATPARPAARRPGAGREGRPADRSGTGVMWGRAGGPRFCQRGGGAMSRPVSRDPMPALPHCSKCGGQKRPKQPTPSGLTCLV
jgi:hypothetical protein